MPNTKSAIKRVRRADKQTSVNRIRKSKYRASIKEISLLITANKKSEAIKLLPKLKYLIFQIRCLKKQKKMVLRL